MIMKLVNKEKKMEEIKNFFNSIWNIRIINSIIIILLSLFLYKFITYFISKGEKNAKSKMVTGKKRETYLKLVKSLIRYIFIIVTILIILEANGINVSSVLAGVGILGVVFGFAMQDWLKDIIRGSSILSDSYFSVGDIVKYKDIEGKVLVIGLKSTKIQELKTGYVKTIANRNIEEIDVVSNLIYIYIPMSYDLQVHEAEKVINIIVQSIKKNNNVTNCRYIGVHELADSTINYCIEIACNQQYKLQVRRDALRTVLIEMENNGIKIPYTQIDIHNK